MKLWNFIICGLFIAGFSTAQAKPKTNPDISVNILLLGKKTFSGEESHHHHHHEEDSLSSNHDHTREGFSIQEVEFYFKSNIDPYWSGNVSVGLFQEESGFQMEVEEAYIESLFIPSLTLKAGQFYAFLGRHNNLHTHYYPFIEPPLANKSLFGDHGFNETGLSLAYLSPLPWYSEIVAQAFYSYADKTPVSALLFFKNLWELNDSSTLEFNISYGSGIKNFKQIFDSALVFKWKALESFKSVSWTTEWLQAARGPIEDIKGVHSDIQWQFLKSWHLQGRVSALMNKRFNIEKQKYSTLLSFTPTEYSAIRLQYDMEKSDHGGWSHGVAVQSNMSLGTHPAHLY